MLGTELFPWKNLDLLDPLSSELVLYCGWRLGARPVMMYPVFTGPITNVSYGFGSGQFTLNASDRVESIIKDNFTSPQSSGVGTLVTTRMMDLINDSQPGATFATIDETGAEVPALTWDSARARALDDLAAAVGAYWYQLPDGRYTIRTIPWSADLGEPVVTYLEGSSLLGGTITRSREQAATVCQVTGEAPNGEPPVIGVAIDDNPSSPTYYLGPLGRRVLQVREDSVASTAQAQGLARQRLRRANSVAATITTTSLFDPTLELGDVGSIVTDGGTYVRALSGFSAELGSSPTMECQWLSPGVEGDAA